MIQGFQQINNFSIFKKSKNEIWEAIMAFLILVTLILKFILNFKFVINLDEFHFLSFVYQFKNHTLSNYFGTFHSLLFLPFIGIFSNEVTTIVAIRTFLFFIFLANCYFTFYISRLFFDRLSSLFVVFCYISFTYVFLNACSFRYGSLCSPLFLFSIFVVYKLDFKYVSITIAALLLSISLLFTIKTVIHVICFSMILVSLSLRNSDLKNTVKKISFFFTALLIIYFSLNLFYGAIAFHNPFEIFLIIKKYFTNSFKTFMVPYTSSYSPIFLTESLIHDFLIWALMLIGSVCYFSRFTVYKFTNILLYVSLFSPILFLFIYRNTFPYFYLFIMSPPIIFTGFCIHAMKQKLSLPKLIASDAIILLVLCIIFTITVSNFKAGYRLDNSNEKQLLDIVHRIFPEPVNYIDGTCMISSFPEIGIFTSSKGMELYLSKNKPIFKNILLSKNCSLLIADTNVLDLSKKKREDAVSSKGYSLLSDDWEVLKNNFIQQWGIIYVPGKKIELTKTAHDKNFEILIPGIYTVESESTVRIDGANCIPGSTIKLKRGHHKISALIPCRLSLRFGKNLYKPNTKPFQIEAIHSSFL